MLDPGTCQNYLNDGHDNFVNQITSSEESDVVPDAESLKIGLRTKRADWATSLNITNTSLGSLLSILNRYPSELSLDPALCSGHQRLTSLVVWRQAVKWNHFVINKGIQRLADNGILFKLFSCNLLMSGFHYLRVLTCSCGRFYA